MEYIKSNNNNDDIKYKVILSKIFFIQILEFTYDGTTHSTIISLIMIITIIILRL